VIGRPRGGSRLTTVVCVLAFAAVANTVGGGLRVVYSGQHQLHSLRLVINLAASVLLCAWALVRVRAQWGEDAGAPSVIHAEGVESTDNGATRSPTRFPSWLRWARRILMIGLLAVAAVTIAFQWGTLETAFGQLKHLHWRSLRWPIYAEALALVAFAQLTRLLLRAGGVSLGLGSMIGLTLASNGVALTLPGGPAWAVTF
jgi:hypothetical protein